MAPTGNPFTFQRVGSALAENEVHAVTGATQTSNRLEKLLNEDVATWRDALKEREVSP